VRVAYLPSSPYRTSVVAGTVQVPYSTAQRVQLWAGAVVVGAGAGVVVVVAGGVVVVLGGVVLGVDVLAVGVLTAEVDDRMGAEVLALACPAPSTPAALPPQPPPKEATKTGGNGLVSTETEKR